MTSDVLFDHVQSVTRLVWAALAQSQTSARSVRGDSCSIQTHCCVAWRATRTAHRGPTYTTTSSPAWVATATVTHARDQATMNARPAPFPNTFIVSIFQECSTGFSEIKLNLSSPNVQLTRDFITIFVLPLMTNGIWVWVTDFDSSPCGCSSHYTMKSDNDDIMMAPLRIFHNLGLA